MARTALIAEKEAFMRDLLKKALPNRYNGQYEADDGLETVEIVERNAPDLAVIKADLPASQGIDGFTAIQRISKKNIDTTLLAIIENPSEQVNALRCGAHGYVSTPISDTDIEDELDAIEAAQTPRKERFFDGKLRATLIHPDGSAEEQTNYGDVLITDYGSIALHEQDTPDWVQAGTDAVLGEPDGSVFRSFVITQVEHDQDIFFLR